MARRKLGDRDVRILSKRTNSYALTIPIEEIRALKWRSGQKLVVSRRGKELIIRDWKK